MKFVADMWHPNGKCRVSKKLVLDCKLLSQQILSSLSLFFFCLRTVEKNGDVCISILHEPGEDKWGYEKPEERWLPVHTVETILLSVISMLADPNDESPANVDAAVSHVVQTMGLSQLCMLMLYLQCG